MPKKIRKVRTFARTATKSQEKNLIENAKKLRENPLLILPKCMDPHCEKYFSKLQNRLERVQQFKDDSNKLEKIANRKGLEGAYAGTLSLAISEKAPYLGVIKFPTGDITYAQRGKADKEKLIALQHFDDPVLRILGVKDLALRKRLYIYSWDKEFVSTGKEPHPPKEFISFIVRKLNLRQKEKIVFCDHLEPKKIEQKEFDKEFYLRILWKSGKITIGICENCAKAQKNTLFDISKYMLVPNLSQDFDIDVIAQVVKYENEKKQSTTQFIEEYLNGSLTDQQFIFKNIKDQKQSLKQSEEKVLVLDGVSYGTNVQAFIDKLQPKKYERPALEFMLEHLDEPVVVTDASPNKILEMYWKKFGEKFIKTVIDDKEMAKSFFHLDDIPSNITKMVYEYKERQKVLAQLPQFKALPKLARFADDVARTYKTFGPKKAINEIKKHPDSPKGRSLAYAFLLALDKGKDSKWKYSKEELEYGEFLKQYAKQLLNEEPKRYRDSLQQLLSASGSSEKIS